jgi:hypothetical protein
MSRGTNLALSGAVAVAAFILGFIVDKAFLHKGFMDETRKLIKRRMKKYREAT